MVQNLSIGTHTSQPLLLEQLREWGIELSRGQINQILLQGKDAFDAEKYAVLQAGLATSLCVTVEDSGARHQGKNGFFTHIAMTCLAGFKVSVQIAGLTFWNCCAQGKQIIV